MTAAFASQFDLALNSLVGTILGYDLGSASALVGLRLRLPIQSFGGGIRSLHDR
jgi:hypothetical protein